MKHKTGDNIELSINDLTRTNAAIRTIKAKLLITIFRIIFNLGIPYFANSAPHINENNK